MRGIKIWVWVGAISLVIPALALTISHWTGCKASEAFTSVGSILTAIGLILAVITLQSAHDWNRRHYTVEFGSDWNVSARPHLAALETAYPDFFKVPDFSSGNQSDWHLDTATAKRLVESRLEPGETQPSPDLALRGHLIDLLNYFEVIAEAYEQHVVDRAAVDDSFGPPILDVVSYFQPFIEEMRNVNRRDVWPPLTRVSAIWLADARRKKAQGDAALATESYKAAMEKGRLKSGTGS